MSPTALPELRVPRMDTVSLFYFGHRFNLYMSSHGAHLKVIIGFLARLATNLVVHQAGSLVVPHTWRYVAPPSQVRFWDFRAFHRMPKDSLGSRFVFFSIRHVLGERRNTIICWSSSPIISCILSLCFVGINIYIYIYIYIIYIYLYVCIY